jgi:hypothetical protein
MVPNHSQRSILHEVRMDPLTEQQLATLFRETKSAHILAFASTSGDDPDWPSWYAEYLRPRLQQLLGRRFSVETLVAELKALDADYSRVEQREPWPEFYARSFLSRHSV